AAMVPNRATSFSDQPSRNATTVIGIFRLHDEIFVSDGSKSDCGYVLDILGDQNKVAIPDPVYPVYVDTNVMAGHTGPARKDSSYEGIYYLPCTAKNNFVPEPPKDHVDLVYLCFPNNPTGAVVLCV